MESLKPDCTAIKVACVLSSMPPRSITDLIWSAVASNTNFPLAVRTASMGTGPAKSIQSVRLEAPDTMSSARLSYTMLATVASMLAASASSSEWPQAELGDPLKVVYGASFSSSDSMIVSGRMRASRASRMEVRTSRVLMSCRGWSCGDEVMPGPRFKDRMGEGGIRVGAPAGVEEKDILRGVAVGSM